MIQVYCDGSCLGNPGIGGWAAIHVLNNKVVNKFSGHDFFTTNNKMELTAAYQGITTLKHVNRGAIMYTDSLYLKNGITIWINRWKRSNWNKGKVKNIRYWLRIYSLIQYYNISWRWVPAHSGNYFNELTDSIARASAKNVS